jgi:hypothetical protein
VRDGALPAGRPGGRARRRHPSGSRVALGWRGRRLPASRRRTGRRSRPPCGRLPLAVMGVTVDSRRRRGGRQRPPPPVPKLTTSGWSEVPRAARPNAPRSPTAGRTTSGSHGTRSRARGGERARTRGWGRYRGRGGRGRRVGRRDPTETASRQAVTPVLSGRERPARRQRVQAPVATQRSRRWPVREGGRGGRGRRVGRRRPDRNRFTTSSEARSVGSGAPRPAPASAGAGRDAEKPALARTRGWARRSGGAELDGPRQGRGGQPPPAAGPAGRAGEHTAPRMPLRPDDQAAPAARPEPTCPRPRGAPLLALGAQRGPRRLARRLACRLGAQRGPRRLARWLGAQRGPRRLVRRLARNGRSATAPPPSPP